jgi:hypothetical protein
VIGALGIIGGLWFTAANFREDSKNRLVTNLLAIDERHRVLWSEALQRQDLKRILSPTVDFEAEPLTPEEDVFLRRIILHFETGWRLEMILERGEMKLLAKDAGSFFKLPLPHVVWDKTKEFRNPRFVRFVERALGNPPLASGIQIAAS